MSNRVCAASCSPRMDYGNGEGSFCRFLYILHLGGGGGEAEEKLLIKQQSKVGIGDPL